MNIGETCYKIMEWLWTCFDRDWNIFSKRSKVNLVMILSKCVVDIESFPMNPESLKLEFSIRNYGLSKFAFIRLRIYKIIRNDWQQIMQFREKLESLADVAKIKGAIGNRQKTTRISDRVINRLISYQTLRNSRELGDQIAFGRPIGCQTQPIRVSFRVIIDRGGAPI